MNLKSPPHLIFHIDADAFFASVEQGFNPQLRGKPVIVGGTDDQRGVVHTASYEARAKGVRTGMPLAEAKHICPQAVFLKGNYQHYQAASLVMQEVYLRYTPTVEFTSLDDAYLEINDVPHLYSSPAQLASQIQQEIEDALHISVSIGIGTNKLIARIASGLKKPGGIVYIPVGQEWEFLQPLPIDILPGIGRVTKEKLTELSVFQIGHLSTLPKLVLNELFGSNGNKIWEYANGIDHREVKRRMLPKQISRETTFEEDLTDREVIFATLQYLSERIAAKLRQQEQLCGQVAVKIRYSDFTQHKVSKKLTHATDNATDIFREVEKSLEGLPLKRLRVRHVGVNVGKIGWNNAQLTFFHEENKWELLDAAVDQIRHKFGFTSILPADILVLRKKYRMEKNGYVLHSPALTK